MESTNCQIAERAVAAEPLCLPVVRVYADASPRTHRVGWGAVIVAEGRKPHILGGEILSRRNSNAAEAVAMVLARDATRRWLKRHDIRAELLVVHSDNQSVATSLMERMASKRITYRWVAREHAMMRLAHRRARVLDPKV